MKALEKDRALAVVYMDTGRYAEAESLYREVLETSKRVYGRDDQTTAMTLYNLACLDAKRGEPAEARDWLRRDGTPRRNARGDGDPPASFTPKRDTDLLERSS